jgi:hypothetical protein
MTSGFVDPVENEDYFKELARTGQACALCTGLFHTAEQCNLRFKCSVCLTDDHEDGRYQFENACEKWLDQVSKDREELERHMHFINDTQFGEIDD